MNDCDYIKDSRGGLWIVAGNSHPLDAVRGHLVYTPSVSGDRVLDGASYSKVVSQPENLTPSLVALSDVVRSYEPRRFFSDCRDLIPAAWLAIPDALTALGVPASDIGVFGSLLLGFPVVHDVDFVVYGRANRDLVRSGISSLMSSTSSGPITPEHIAYQTSSKGSSFSSDNSWERMLANKWSSLQFSPGVLSTIRFVYKKDEEPYDIWKNEIIRRDFSLDGIVRSSFGTDFRARRFSLETSHGVFDIGTYFWMYQSCVRDGDLVSVRGNLRSHSSLTLDSLSHSITYL